MCGQMPMRPAMTTEQDTMPYTMRSANLPPAAVRAKGASVHVMLPTQGSEEKLGGLAVGVDRACSELDMQVTAFQGEVTGAVRQTVVFASVAGTGKLPLSQKKTGTGRLQCAQESEKGRCAP